MLNKKEGKRGLPSLLTSTSRFFCLWRRDDHVQHMLMSRCSWYPSEIHPERYAYERFFRRIAIMSGMEGLIPPMGDEESINSEESDDSDRYSASNE